MRKKSGVVVILDALGASNYSTSKIKYFLQARNDINKFVKEFSGAYKKGNFRSPIIYTFGDTIIITFELRSKKYLKLHMFAVINLMRRYLYHSFVRGILFRGAFSFGTYLEDEETNTVMGQAVTDAASWYEQSLWIGVHSTPKTKNVFEFHYGEMNPLFCTFYEVPMKQNSSVNLLTISWPGGFWDIYKHQGGKMSPESRFLELFKDFEIPKGEEIKYENTRKYFDFIATEIANKRINSDA